MTLIARAPFKPQIADYFAYILPGEPPPADALPGDIVLTHGSHPFSRLIRLAQRIRYRGEQRHFARWNHAAVVVDREGGIVEALSRGVVRRNLSDYNAEEYVVIYVTSTAESRAHAVDYLEWIASIGTRYGWGLIASIFIGLLTGGRLSINRDGSEICSTLAAEALKPMGYRFNRAHVMPADFAHYFGIGAAA